MKNSMIKIQSESPLKVISPKQFKGSGVSSEILAHFVNFWKPASRVGFYPSSGHDIGPVLELDWDACFFADVFLGVRARSQLLRFLRDPRQEITMIEENEDFLVFEKGSKRGYYLFIENNQAIDLITRVAGCLHLFIGVRDGCVEGGNFECVNNLPYIEKVVKLAPPEGMDLYLDHSEFFDLYPEFIFDRKRVQYMQKLPLKLNKHPLGPTRHYHVVEHVPEITRWTHGNLTLTIEHDNLVNHYAELDGIVGPAICRKMVNARKKYNQDKFYIPPLYFFYPHLKPGWTAKHSLESIYRVTQERGWRTVGVTAFGQGDHDGFLSIITRWVCENPLWLRFFHLDRDDFQSLKTQMNLYFD